MAGVRPSLCPLRTRPGAKSRSPGKSRARASFEASPRGPWQGSDPYHVRNRRSARCREVLIVDAREVQAPAPAPADGANARTTASPRGSSRGGAASASRKRPAGRGSTPAPRQMYGFSSGLTSIARPYACCDHDVLPSRRPAVERRRVVAPPSSGRRCPRGPRARSPEARLVERGRRARPADGIAVEHEPPVCATASKPQYVGLTKRRSEMGTGQPACQDESRGAGATVAWNAQSQRSHRTAVQG